MPIHFFANVQPSRSSRSSRSSRASRFIPFIPVIPFIHPGHPGHPGHREIDSTCTLPGVRSWVRYVGRGGKRPSKQFSPAWLVIDGKGVKKSKSKACVLGYLSGIRTLDFPWVLDGAFTTRPTIYLTLSYQLVGWHR